MIIKNSNLRINLSQNRYKILAIIVAIILILCLIQVMNQMAKQANKKQNETNASTNTIKHTSTYKPQETVVQGEDVSTKQQEINTNVINNFIEYCNKKEVQKAYNLLTKECQEQFYASDINKFKQNYIDKIFKTKKTYSMQSWMQSPIGYTYKVKITQDMLATGNVGQAIEECYTIVKQNGEYKINLNNYIGKQNINETVTSSGITITVISKSYFMEYETYEVKVQNNTENTIILDTKEKQKSVYVTGNNNGTYTGYMHEIDDIFLSIKPQLYRIYNIKFNKMYDAQTKINSMTFTDIITNADEYNNTVDKKEYKNRKTMTVKL